jgi:hypothetical protein
MPTTSIIPNDPRNHHLQLPALQRAKDILETIDTKNQGFIDNDELKAAVLNLTPTQVAGRPATGSGKIDALFKKLDVNGDGKIDESELEKAVKEMGSSRRTRVAVPATIEAIPELTTYEPADKNKDGVTSVTEFLVYELSMMNKARTDAANASAPLETRTAHSASTMRKDAYSVAEISVQSSGKHVRTEA